MENTIIFNYINKSNFEINIKELSSIIIEDCPNENNIDDLLDDFSNNIYYYLKKLGFPGDSDSIDDGTYDYIHDKALDSLEEILKLSKK